MKKKDFRLVRVCVLLSLLVVIFACTTAFAAQLPAPKLTCDEGNQSVSLRWNKIEAADGFEVYCYPYGGTEKSNTIARNVTGCTLKNLKNGKTYLIYVRAYQMDGDEKVLGRASKKYKVTLTSKVPGEVTGLTALGGDRMIELKWNKAKNAKKYEVYLKKEDGSFKLVATTAKRSIRIKKLTNNKDYSIKVRGIIPMNGDPVGGKFSETIVCTPFLRYSPDNERSNVVDDTVHPYYWKAKTNTELVLNDIEFDTRQRIPAGSDVLVVKEGRYVPTNVRIIWNKLQFNTTKSNVNISGLYTNKDKPYSKGLAEWWVNTSGFNSPTNIIVWVNTYTQHIYIFQGSQYHWTMVKRFICSTGTYGSSETPLMKYSALGSKTAVVRWSSSQYGFWATGIPSGQIHSWLMRPDGVHYDSPNNTLGYPASHGCVRVDPIENAKWIYDNCPSGSRFICW